MSDVIYSELLYSPGYKVDFAVGTTYSLDLEAMLMVPAAFGMLGDGGNDITQHKSLLLEAIRQSSRHMAVFYNATSMGVPKNDLVIYPLLEKSLYPVRQVGSFHPKIWVIKETSMETHVSRIKVISMSRNLTMDDSIDTAVCMTGEMEAVKQDAEKHRPLIELLKYLARTYCTDKAMKRKIESLAADVAYVHRFDVDDPFVDYDFLPLSPALHKGWKEVMDSMQGRYMVVVSPFVTDSMIKDLTSRSGKENSILVTRTEMIDKCAIEHFGKVYGVNEEMINSGVGSINLHAKMYYVSYPPASDGFNYLYIGSANATTSAFSRNTEFLLRLKYKKHAASMDKFMEMMNGDNQFVRVTMPTCDEVTYDKESPEEATFKNVLKAQMEANVVQKGDSYGVEVTFGHFEQEVDVYLAPLQRRAMKTLIKERKVNFVGLELHQLSAFYVLTAGSGTEAVSSVVKIATKGIPGNRDQMIFQSVIDTKEKFIEYMSMKFTDNPMSYLYGLEEQQKLLQVKGCSGKDVVYTSLYEDMLRQIYRDPHSLDDVEDIINLLGKVVPKEFRTMYAVFKEAAKRLK